MQPLGPNDPQSVGPYRLTHVLGSGGMGRVYLARTASGRRVAVKVVHSEHMRNTEFRARFVREVQAARRVGGFHTAQVVDADTEAEQPWIASAYIPGPSLHTVVSEHGPLPEPSLRVLAAGLAEGLLTIHRADLAHRDLKPGNILVAAEGPRIIDFGIALPGEDTQLTRTGTVLGTPAYMSPEQASEDSKASGPASDVFTYGTVLHYAATGDNPFQAQTIMGSLARLLTAVPEVPPGLPGDLAEIITRCWDRDPKQRPDLAEVLNSLEGVDPDTAWPPHPDRSARTGSSTGAGTSSASGAASDAQETVAGPPQTLMATRQLRSDAPARNSRAAHADSLLRRAEEFRELRLHEDARTTATEAVGLYRSLYRGDPGTHRVNLAAALQGLAADLDDLKRGKEALAAGSEALELYRTLSGQDPDAHREGLALALHRQAVYLARLGRNTAAAPLNDEAIALRRVLAEQDLAAHGHALTQSLGNRALDLQEQGRHEEALRFSTETLSLRRTLAEHSPEYDRAHLAEALHTQSLVLEELRRPADSLRMVAEEVSLWRALAREGHASSMENLAHALHNQGVDLHALGRAEEAADSIEEAVDIHRLLEKKQPGRHTLDLQASLSYLSSLFTELDRGPEAAEVDREAAALARGSARR